MSKRKQIGYSLSLWETLKEYNEETKWFEPIKNKKVEVAQMLSEELSDNEEVKSLLIDKMFGYKDDIKQLLKKGEYSDIPSYHKESLEKDQKIADLEAKLAEKEKEIESLRDKLFYEQADNAKHISGIIKLQFEQVQAEKDKISLAVEQLEKVKDVIGKNFDGIGFNTYCERVRPIEKYINNQIEELKKEMK